MPLLLLSNPVGACDWAATTTASTTTNPAMTRDLIIFPPGPLGVRTSDYGGRATAPSIYQARPSIKHSRFLGRLLSQLCEEAVRLAQVGLVLRIHGVVSYVVLDDQELDRVEPSGLAKRPHRPAAVAHRQERLSEPEPVAGGVRIERHGLAERGRRFRVAALGAAEPPEGRAGVAVPGAQAPGPDVEVLRTRPR